VFFSSGQHEGRIEEKEKCEQRDKAGREKEDEKECGEKGREKEGETKNEAEEEAVQSGRTGNETD